MRAPALVLAAMFAAIGAPASDARPLVTAIFDPYGAAAKTGYEPIQATGATAVRIRLLWGAIAPSRPATPADPADPGYSWAGADAQVRGAVDAGLDPILDLVDAPPWALEPGTSNPGTPVAADLGAFARAAAARYSGSFEDLPRVRFWQVWNEPNLATQLSPQLVKGRPVGALAYRAMVNSVAAAVKSVSAGNLVVAGGLAPFRDITPATYKQDRDWGPLSFMRAFFCLSKTLESSCSSRARLDVWAHHPYTSGGPTHHAVLPDDVSLGDLPELNATLRAAVRTGHVLPHRLPQLWVTEFSWDSAPPDAEGVPTALLKRWVPQALYQMWRNGVSVVTWFLLDDRPLSASPYQSGLRYADGSPKPYLKGFRFPTVAFPRPGGFYVWGRTPAGSPGVVTVEQRVGAGWRRVGRVRTTAAGIFQATLRASTSGWVRGRLAGGERSLAFSLASVPDRFFNPFGSPGKLESRP